MFLGLLEDFIRSIDFSSLMFFIVKVLAFLLLLFLNSLDESPPL
jgi:hypothetical protein